MSECAHHAVDNARLSLSAKVLVHVPATVAPRDPCTKLQQSVRGPPVACGPNAAKRPMTQPPPTTAALALCAYTAGKAAHLASCLSGCADVHLPRT